jgi:nitrogen fixation protein FixH
MSNSPPRPAAYQPSPPTELSGNGATKAAWIWGSVVVAFLVLQLVIGGAAFRLAGGDPSVAVMPDYHQRALNWDDELARRSRSDSLRWRATVHYGRPVDGASRQVTIRVADADGLAITGGGAELLFFHHTRAADVMTMPLAERDPGEYVATLPIVKPGLWDLEFTLARGEDERFLDRRTIDIDAVEIEAADVSSPSAAESDK